MKATMRQSGTDGDWLSGTSAEWIAMLQCLALSHANVALRRKLAEQETWIADAIEAGNQGNHAEGRRTQQRPVVEVPSAGAGWPARVRSLCLVTNSYWTPANMSEQAQALRFSQWLQGKRADAQHANDVYSMHEGRIPAAKAAEWRHAFDEHSRANETADRMYALVQWIATETSPDFGKFAAWRAEAASIVKAVEG